MGYHRAGFDVVGVDINPQPNYPFEFHQVDALMLMDDLLEGWPIGGFAAGWLLSDFAAIHASPPCQHYSNATKMQGRYKQATHPDLLAPTRQRLVTANMPYVIENVANAPLRGTVRLCGTMFGLEGRGYYLKRHRTFETSFEVVFAPWSCAHPRNLRALDVTGHPNGKRGGATASPRFTNLFDDTATRQLLMGIDWVGGDGLSEAIPPVYTEWIGAQLLGSMAIS
jgi:DNA (cytosine-5)-methyltransferase 1